MITAYRLSTGPDGHSHVARGIIDDGECFATELDTTGTGHKWRLINDQPWKRAYVTFNESTKFNFRPDGSVPR